MLPTSLSLARRPNSGNFCDIDALTEYSPSSEKSTSLPYSAPSTGLSSLPDWLALPLAALIPSFTAFKSWLLRRASSTADFLDNPSAGFFCSPAKARNCRHITAIIKIFFIPFIIRKLTVKPAQLLRGIKRHFLKL